MSQHVTSLRSLALVIREFLPQPGLISFDVFDTLVRRTLPHPDFSKVPVARILQSHVSEGAAVASLEAIIKKRLEAESALRSLAKTEGFDPECRIMDVFESWAHSLDIKPTPELLRSLLHKELDFERSVTYAQEGIDNLLSSLQADGHKLVFTSDTYYDQAMIEEILENCGLSPYFDAGFVSSEHKLAKYSGRLFEKLLDECDVSPDRVIHVGDRLDSDVAGARKSSIRAVQYFDPDKIAIQSVTGAANRVRRRNPFWNGLAWCNRGIATPHHRDMCSADLRFSIGYDYLGPLFANYVHRLADELASTGADLVIFSSRDGYLLREIYERFKNQDWFSHLPQSSYGYLTRKSVYNASLRDFGKREFEMGFYTVDPTLRNMFRRFSLPEDELVDAARRAGFQDLDKAIPDPHSSKKLQEFVRDPEFLAVLGVVQSDASRLIEDYLASLGYWQCKSVALVDVGWNGTVQESLDIAFEDHPDAPVIHGYYMALLGNKVMRSSDRSVFHGIFHDYRKSKAGSFFARFVELFETATRAPHGTVIGLQRNERGEVLPRFRADDTEERQAELRDESLVASLQAGVLAYTDDYIRTIQAHDAPADQQSDFILSKLDRLIRYPTKQEARLLSSFAHSEGFGQTLVYRGTGLSEADHDEKPKHQRILWKEGQYRMTNIPGLNLALNGYRVLRRRLY